MIVTDLKYSLEKRLVAKLDIMIQRVTQPHPKKDAALIVEGGEGEGKTSSSEGIAYYIKSKTGRDIHLFFKLEPLIQFAQSTKEKIIIWDEPSLDALGTDWYKEVNMNLIRLLMTVRKNRHFFLFNFTKFYKFSEYIVVDRSLGLVHMYSRNEVEPGRFVYIKRKNLERLYLGYKISKKRLYKKLTSFRGSFPEIHEKYFSSMGIYINGKIATLEDYENEKDKSIMGIGKKEDKEYNKYYVELEKLRLMIGGLTYPIKSRTELSQKLNVALRSLARWIQKHKQIRDSDISPNDASATTHNYNTNGWVDDVDDVIQKDTNNNEPTKLTPA